MANSSVVVVIHVIFYFAYHDIYDGTLFYEDRFIINYGESEIAVSRGRNDESKPCILQKRQAHTNEIE